MFHDRKPPEPHLCLSRQFSILLTTGNGPVCLPGLVKKSKHLHDTADLEDHLRHPGSQAEGPVEAAHGGNKLTFALVGNTGIVVWQWISRIEGHCLLKGLQRLVKPSCIEKLYSLIQRGRRFLGK